MPCVKKPLVFMCSLLSLRCIENMHVWALAKRCFDMGANKSMDNGYSLMQLDAYLWYDAMCLYHVIDNTADIIIELDAIFNVYCFAELHKCDAMLGVT